MYHRVFGHIKKVRWQIYAAGALTLPIFVSIFAQSALVSPPPGTSWGTPHPLSQREVIPSLMVGIDNLVVDLLVAYIPIPVIRKLNLSRSKKNAIIALFATGML